MNVNSLTGCKMYIIRVHLTKGSIKNMRKQNEIALKYTKKNCLGEVYSNDYHLFFNAEPQYVVYFNINLYVKNMHQFLLQSAPRKYIYRFVVIQLLYWFHYALKYHNSHI